MQYHAYELAHACISPARLGAGYLRRTLGHPANPLSYTYFGKSVAAACQVFESSTRRYGKPHYGIDAAEIDGQVVAVSERCVWHKPFCRLLHFSAALPDNAPARPRVLLVAPLSGHYASLLRGTVETLLAGDYI